MNDSQDEFSPLIIDQQIDDPEAFLPSEEARFLREVRAMFEQEKSASIEQGWSRLASQRAGADQPPEILNLSRYRQQSERNSKVQDNTMSSTPETIPPKKRRMRWFGLLVAVLVCALLIGSLSFVLTLAKNNTSNTKVGGSNGVAEAHTASPTPAATPLTIPASCLDKSTVPDLAAEVLCAQGQETTINVTKSMTANAYNPWGKVSGSGALNITFLRAYADTSRLLLTATLNHTPGADWGSFGSLVTQQGTLQSINGCSSGPCVLSFDTSTLPAGTTQVQVQGLQVLTAGLDVEGTIPLSFTLPLHTASKTIAVNQTVQDNGVSATLKSVVITPSEVIFHFTSTSTPQAVGFHSIQVIAITINGQKQNVATSSNSNGEGDRTNYTEQENLYLALLDHPGSWTVTIAPGTIPDPHSTRKPSFTGVFTFTVPV